jgi:hypothetical protein
MPRFLPVIIVTELLTEFDSWPARPFLYVRLLYAKHVWCNAQHRLAWSIFNCAAAVQCKLFADINLECFCACAVSVNRDTTSLNPRQRNVNLATRFSIGQIPDDQPIDHLFHLSGHLSETVNWVNTTEELVSEPQWDGSPPVRSTSNVKGRGETT